MELIDHSRSYISVDFIITQTVDDILDDDYIPYLRCICVHG